MDVLGKADENFEVKVYAGFTEHAHRLVFDYQDHFATSPHLLTILPAGTIENDKTLEPKKDKGLIAYTYPQSMRTDASQDHIDTPFVWKREDGSYALVQTWPTSFNDKFRSDYSIETSNPDPLTYIPQAVTEFRKTIDGLFGEEAKERPILYCHRASENTKTVYVGTAQELMRLLKACPRIMIELSIVALTENSFECRFVDGKGDTGTKTFKFAPAETYALYTKQGWETMACITPVEQFLVGRDYHAEKFIWSG